MTILFVVTIICGVGLLNATLHDASILPLFRAAGCMRIMKFV